MKHASAVLLIAIAASLALTACGPSTLVANAVPPQRLLSVTGSGLVYLAPDVAYINIGVHTDRATASEAVSSNSAQTQQVIAALKEFGVEDADIKTTSFSIYPNVQYDPQTNQEIGTTYVVDNTVHVTVRQIDMLGDLLDATVSAGANRVNSIQFDAADKSAAIKQARDAAVEDATTQARELAAAAGVSLGSIHQLDFYNAVPSPVISGFGKGGGGGLEAASVPIEAGQLTVTANVSISYQIK
jgi:uncharacterized protein YggE